MKVDGIAGISKEVGPELLSLRDIETAVSEILENGSLLAIIVRTGVAPVDIFQIVFRCPWVF